MDITQASIAGILLLCPEDSIEIVNNKCDMDWFTGDYKLVVETILRDGGGDPMSLAKKTGLKPNTLLEWTTLEFSVTALDKHINNLSSESTDRQIKNLARTLLTSGDNDKCLAMIETFRSRVKITDRTEPITAREAMLRLSRDLERRNAHKGILGMTYGIPDLDEKTEGLHRGDLVVIAAPSSMGKTAFAGGVIEAACEAGHRGLVFTLEMTTEQLMMRSLAAKTGISLGKIRAARFNDADWPRLTRGFGEIAELPMLVDDPSGMPLAEVIRKARKAAKDGLDILLIDYLQIMKYDKSKEVQELDVITTELKHLAKELNINVMILSQLNRAGQKEKRKPSMTDLRGSGMIENNADVILFPWRPAADCQECLENVTTAKHNPEVHKRQAGIIIGKQRQGERNIEIPVVWMEEKTRFMPLSRYEG